MSGAEATKFGFDKVFDKGSTQDDVRCVCSGLGTACARPGFMSLRESRDTGKMATNHGSVTFENVSRDDHGV